MNGGKVTGLLGFKLGTSSLECRTSYVVISYKSTIFMSCLVASRLSGMFAASMDCFLFFVVNVNVFLDYPTKIFRRGAVLRLHSEMFKLFRMLFT